jgi:hypothetical protein
MYCLEFTIKPTAAMTFRILPGSILNIATYPFVPPTTLSGYLRRLAMLSAGQELPETKVNNENPPVYALPSKYMSLGAYPKLDAWSGIHRTYRKGMRSFNHDDFSKLYVDGKGEDFQLHTWEYLIVDELVGYVAAESLEGLEHFQDLVGYGCKIGKEGYAYITDISDQPIELELVTTAAHPSTLLPMEALLNSNQFIGGCDIYNLYRYEWENGDRSLSFGDGFLDSEPTPVKGFTPFVCAYFPRPTDPPPRIDYYTNGEIYIPVSLVNLLREETYV